MKTYKQLEQPMWLVLGNPFRITLCDYRGYSLAYFTNEEPVLNKLELRFWGIVGHENKYTLKNTLRDFDEDV